MANSTLGENTNELSTEMQELTKTLRSVLQKRFKNDPNRVDQELAKIKAKIGNNQNGDKQLKKLEKILDPKAAAEKRKLEIATAKEVAKLQLATATTAQEKALATEALRAAKTAESAELLKDAGKQLVGNLAKIALNFGATMDKGIEEYAGIFSKYQASVEARLQDGTTNDNKRFKALVDTVKANLAASPYLKQETMLNNLNELIQLGVNYNIEQRAFLQSMTDKVVTTFNAFDSNLLNIIRLQQADSTAARMGIEALLTKSFNSMFKDTSYLGNSGAYDTVSSNLFETIAQLGRDEGLEFEYVVQKWLGSLGSVGVSNDTLSKIATAINYLGTGNVQALQSDSAMMNLLTLSANRQGLDIGGILNQGLNAETTNTLLRGIVDYVQEISASNNMVVRQQFGQLFGFSMSDMVAALNLNTDQLNSVQESMIDFTKATAEAQNQLNQVGSRMHLSELIDNAFENVMATTAGNIASNAGTYALWRTLNLVESLTSGIAIPTISVMGSGVDLETTVVGLMKTGIAGLSLIGTLATAFSNSKEGGSLSLANWGGEEYLQRGTGFSGITTGYQATVSRTVAMGSGSGEDMAEHSITSAQQEGNDKIESAQSQETATEKMLKAIMIAVTGSETADEATPGVLIRTREGIPLDVIVKNDDTSRVPISVLSY